jgi:hypothetical protein
LLRIGPCQPAYHIGARKLLNLFMEMNCVRETFIRLSGLSVIVDSLWSERVA